MSRLSDVVFGIFPSHGREDAKRFNFPRVQIWRISVVMGSGVIGEEY